MTYSIGARRRDQLPRLRPAAARGRLGPDDQREPARRSPSSRGRCSCPCIAIGLLTVGTNLITDGVARAAIGIDRKGPSQAQRHRRRGARTCASSSRAGTPTSSTRSRSTSGRARCSAWSASPARARRPSGMALLGHVRRGGAVGGGAVVIDGRDLVHARRARPAPPARRHGGLHPAGPRHLAQPGAAASRLQLAEMLAAHTPDWSDEQRVAPHARVAGRGRRCPSDDAFLARYPHQLSGGQQQRVAIAMAFACRPHVIVCDEPTTGLDVTTQARVLETVRELCRSHQVAALYVSHDLAVVAELADRVAVMYAGRIVEVGPRDELFSAPRHPYTRRCSAPCPTWRAGAPWWASPATPRCRATGPRAASSTRAAIWPRTSAARRSRRADRGRSGAPGALLPPRRGARARSRPRAARRGPTRTRRRSSCSRSHELNAHARHAPHAVRHRPRGPPPRVPRARRRVGRGQDDARALRRRAAQGLHRRGAAARRRRSRRPRGSGPTPPASEIQYVFQNPYASLNPRRTVGQTIARQLELFGAARQATWAAA